MRFVNDDVAEVARGIVIVPELGFVVLVCDV